MMLINNRKIVSTSTEQTDQTKQLIGNIEELLNAKNGIAKS